MKDVTPRRGGRGTRAAVDGGAETPPPVGRRPASRGKTAARKSVPAPSDPSAAPPEPSIKARGAAPAGPSAASDTRAADPRPAPERAPTHEEIARRAFEIYVARGGGQGHAEEDWLLAEAQLRFAAVDRNTLR